MHRVICETCLDGRPVEVNTVGFVFGDCEICGSQDDTRRSCRVTDKFFDELRMEHLRKRFAFYPGSKWKDWVNSTNWFTFHPEEIYERVPPKKAVEFIRQSTSLGEVEANKLYLYALNWAIFMVEQPNQEEARELQLLMELSREVTTNMLQAARFVVLDDIFEIIAKRRSTK